MLKSESETLVWRVLYGAAVVFVLALFLLSLREILNPFLLFLLLALLLSPLSGTRYHVLVVGTSAVLLVIWLLSTTGFLLAPFLLALVVAYVLHPVVRRIEGPRVSRTLAIVLLALPIVAAVVLSLVVGVPALSAQIATFIQSVPALYLAAVGLAERLSATLRALDLPGIDEDVLLGRVQAIQPEDVIAYLQLRQEEIARAAWQAILGAGRGLGAVLTVLSYVFLTPILSFYLLRDYTAIRARLGGLVPTQRRESLLGFFREYDKLLSRYLRGQLMAAAAVGVLTGIGFWLVGFPYALLLGVVAGVFNVVPYLGLIVSLFPALLIALFSGEILFSLLKITGVFAVVQALDGAVLGPRIVGESVGLHPVWVILALAVAGYFWGFVGLLLAIPLAVLVKLLVVRALARYEASQLFRGEASPLVVQGEDWDRGALSRR